MQSKADHYKDLRGKAERVRPRFRAKACGAQILADGNLELTLPTNTHPAQVVGVILLESIVIDLARFILDVYTEPAASGVLPPRRKLSTGLTKG